MDIKTFEKPWSSVFTFMLELFVFCGLSETLP